MCSCVSTPLNPAGTKLDARCHQVTALPPMAAHVTEYRCP
jgi:hypothetical protein